MAGGLTPVVLPVRHTHPASACNISFVEHIFKSAEMSKNAEIIPLFVLQGLYLANPWPEDRPQYHCRSGTVTRHPPAIFLFSNIFLNCRKWAKLLKSNLYSSSWLQDRPRCYGRSGTVTRHPPAIFPFSNKLLSWWK